MGLNDDIRRITGVSADNGFVALAPDLVGAGFKPLCIARFVQGIDKTGTGLPWREMAAFQAWLGRQPYADADRVGMAGFCIGGGFAITGHSFMSMHGGLLGALGPWMPTHAAFAEGPADDAWRRVLTFFGQHLAERAEPTARSGRQAGS